MSPTPVAVPVSAGSRDMGYEVIVAPGIRHRLAELIESRVPAGRYVVISDSNVAALYGSGIRASLETTGRAVDLLEFPAGETSKSREEWGRLTDAMLGMGADRASVVVALGGGVTGDLAGFVASTYLRGIPVVQVPTTLLAMIDASVGGKTGVNTSLGKNLVGAFHPPALVVADPEFTGTLARRSRAEGLAEAVKHAAIRDEAHMEQLQDRAPALLGGDPGVTGWAVEHSVRIKAEVVSRDERESGLREILNFGHTLGHALEAASGYGLSHGHAVAIGMTLEAALGESLGVTESGTADRIRGALARIELPVEPPAGLEPEIVLQGMNVDKKGRNARPRFVLLRRAGEVAREDSAWSRDVPDDVLGALVTDACGASGDTR